MSIDISGWYLIAGISGEPIKKSVNDLTGNKLIGFTESSGRDMSLNGVFVVDICGNSGNAPHQISVTDITMQTALVHLPDGVTPSTQYFDNNDWGQVTDYMSDTSLNLYIGMWCLLEKVVTNPGWTNPGWNGMTPNTLANSATVGIIVQIDGVDMASTGGNYLAAFNSSETTLTQPNLLGLVITTTLIPNSPPFAPNQNKPFWGMTVNSSSTPATIKFYFWNDATSRQYTLTQTYSFVSDDATYSASNPLFLSN